MGSIRNNEQNKRWRLIGVNSCPVRCSITMDRVFEVRAVCGKAQQWLCSVRSHCRQTLCQWTVRGIYCFCKMCWRPYWYQNSRLWHEYHCWTNRNPRNPIAEQCRYFRSLISTNIPPNYWGGDLLYCNRILLTNSLSVFAVYGPFLVRWWFYLIQYIHYCLFETLLLHPKLVWN